MNATGWNYLQALVMGGPTRLPEVEIFVQMCRGEASAQAISKNSLGMTALMLATGHCDPDNKNSSLRVVELILPLSDPTDCNSDGQNALMIAVASWNVEAVKLLLPLSDAKQIDNYGHTALTIAMTPSMFFMISKAMVELLLPVSDVNHVVASTGFTSLMYAAEKRDHEILSILMPVSNTKALDYKKQTALKLLLRSFTNSKLDERDSACVLQFFKAAVVNQNLEQMGEIVNHYACRDIVSRMCLKINPLQF
jgi:ankyrin repeat protein